MGRIKDVKRYRKHNKEVINNIVSDIVKEPIMEIREEIKMGWFDKNFQIAMNNEEESCKIYRNDGLFKGFLLGLFTATGAVILDDIYSKRKDKIDEKVQGLIRGFQRNKQGN